MTLKLYAHPFSSYCQKVLIALYENDTPFELRLLEPGNTASTELENYWPLKRFPMLVDDGRAILEASIIIEHLGLYHPGPVRLIPEDARAALEVRMMDRVFDNYIHTPLQKVVLDKIRSVDVRDSHGVTEARSMLETAYHWLNGVMAEREWAVGTSFSLADCSAGPALFYADWTHPISKDLTHLWAYRQRLLARPSFARAINEARPYRAYFPLGAPDRD